MHLPDQDLAGLDSTLDSIEVRMCVFTVFTVFAETDSSLAISGLDRFVGRYRSTWATGQRERREPEARSPPFRPVVQQRCAGLGQRDTGGAER